MIVYRANDQAMDVEEALARQGRRLAATPGAEGLLSLLIEFGELESAVTDALLGTVDELLAATATLRTTSTALAQAYLHAANGGDPGPALEAARRAHGTVAALDLPREARSTVPEGYALYGVHPLSYAAAALRFAGGQPGPAVCIGLRSIGTSLSAVVSAALQNRGWCISAFTLRPHGHPFARRPVLGPLLSETWSKSTGAFLVVDEGPGLSGSSFCGVADALNALGVPDERIIFFPSWDAPAEGLCSPTARTRWPRQRKVVAESHLPVFPAGARDVSAGAWREEVFDNENDHPAVQPQHERRKFLVPAPEGPRLYRFAGLAHHGEARLARGAVLAEAGFGPVPGGLHDGYLDYGYLTGRPLRPSEASREFLETVAHYLAFLVRRFSLPRPAPHQATSAMLVENAGELLGDPWRERAAALAGQSAAWDAPGVALDGRMLPHEWLQTPYGYRKVDALDHHADHFFPGCNDIAWDLATVVEEFALSPEAAEVLVTRYAELSGDGQVGLRLPFQRAAYLAHRLGYATLAGRTLGGTPDGLRFDALRLRYGNRLRQELTRISQT